MHIQNLTCKNFQHGVMIFPTRSDDREHKASSGTFLRHIISIIIGACTGVMLQGIVKIRF